jgi:hypothetical protein
MIGLGILFGTVVTGEIEVGMPPLEGIKSKILGMPIPGTTDSGAAIYEIFPWACPDQ